MVFLQASTAGLAHYVSGAGMEQEHFPVSHQLRASYSSCLDLTNQEVTRDSGSSTTLYQEVSLYFFCQNLIELGQCKARPLGFDGVCFLFFVCISAPTPAFTLAPVTI